MRAQALSRSRSLYLRWLQARDRAWLTRLMRAHSGLQIHPDASSNLASAYFELGRGARLRIEAGVFTERISGGLRFRLLPDAEVTIGEGSWLSSEVQPLRLCAFAGAQIQIGRECWFNGCEFSANVRIEAGDGAMIGPGTRIYDSDHAIDDERSAAAEPVRIGAFTWLASDVTVLRGVEIGDHSVVGARSVVTRSLPAHTLAVGIPARSIGSVGNRRAFM